MNPTRYTTLALHGEEEVVNRGHPLPFSIQVQRARDRPREELKGLQAGYTVERDLHGNKADG